MSNATTKTDADIVEARWVSNETENLLKCMKRFQLFKTALAAGTVTRTSPEYVNLIAEVDAFAHVIDQMAVAQTTNTAQLAQYQSMRTGIEDSIAASSTDIERLKRELEREREVRAHKEEYEALSKVIQQYPSRADTEARITSLTAELAALEQEQRETTRALDVRQKQFSHFFHSLTQLQGELAGDDDDGAGATTSTNAMVTD